MPLTFKSEWDTSTENKSDIKIYIAERDTCWNCVLYPHHNTTFLWKLKVDLKYISQRDTCGENKCIFIVSSQRDTSMENKLVFKSTSQRDIRVGNTPGIIHVNCTVHRLTAMSATHLQHEVGHLLGHTVKNSNSKTTGYPCFELVLTKF